MTDPTPARRSPWLLANLAMLTHRGTQGRQMRRPAARVTRRGAEALLRRWPAAVSMTRTGAANVAHAIQALPRSTAKSLTAGSLGFGAGLYLGHTSRIVRAIGVAPAIVMGASMLRRRDRPGGPPAGRGAGPATRGPELSRLDDDGSPAVAGAAT